MKALHPVFNIVKLLPAKPDPIPGRTNDIPPLPTLVEDTGSEHYELEQILDSRLMRNKLLFLVKWKGYGYEDNQWVAEGDLNAPELLKEFYEKHPGAPRKLINEDFATLPKKRRDTVSKRGGDVRGTPQNSNSEPRYITEVPKPPNPTASSEPCRRSSRLAN
jgi:hypothetical protein